MKEYKINIDPRILELLGPNLYTNIYYILAELIANAYDAAAKNVYLLIEEDKYVLEDDGKGMSYEEGDVDRYLNVAAETRTGAQDEYVKGTNRRKMGRKGVGKLAALSVSAEVEILTRKNGDSSGFVLSRHVNEDHLLRPIPEEKVIFSRVKGDGTAVVMRNPQYDLHKTFKAIRSNILKLFPLVDSDFRIHLVRGAEEEVISEFDKEIVGQLAALICLGSQSREMSRHFNSDLGEELSGEFCRLQDPYVETVKVKGRDGRYVDCRVEVTGWIGVYRSTRERKKDKQDFPDNFISLIANKKIGEYNILPLVGKNKLNEAYVVGQLHVDVFEDSSLPDMALSNRQGYKADDPRYQAVIEWVRSRLLPDIVQLRTKYASIKADRREINKQREKEENERRLKEQYQLFQDHAASEIVERFFGDSEKSPQDIRDIVGDTLNRRLPEIGLKSKVEDSKKKVLISHSSKDKDLADVIYQLLVFNGIDSSQVIYTSNEDEKTRIPNRASIFDYLREFFVESVSSKKIFVIYVTSKDMGACWSAICEVGAGWITQSNHDIFNIKGFTPVEPLNTRSEWHETIRSPAGELVLSMKQADLLAVKIRDICQEVLGASKSKADLMMKVEGLVSVS